MSDQNPLDDLDPRVALEALTRCRAPLLIGVRHHSPVCSAAVESLLTEFGPTRLFVELPPEFQPWLTWLASPELVAPVALAAVSRHGSDLAFYPFADFSPELAALRWAASAGVPVEAFDLPLATREPRQPTEAPTERTLVSWLEHRLEAEDPDDLWDRSVEVRAVGQPAEAVRRAALLAGWAMRVAAAQGGGVSEHDLRREEFMRARIAAAGGERTAAVVGAFHAPALLPDPLLFTSPPTVPSAETQRDVVSSLIPYSHDLLDSRSGYPAGIRDPIWQQRVYEAARSGASLRDVASLCITEVGRAIRGRGHVAGVPDTSEALRVCEDLARLRGLPAPGRREVLEAVQTALAQGELLGRGRVVAEALERTLVGRQRGRLPRDAPRSGLVVHVVALLEELKLPGPTRFGDDPMELRLDPLRSTLDRRRHAALERLGACGVPYARPLSTDAAVIGEALTYRWAVQWSPATDAMLETAGLRGVTLAQAAAGMLSAQRRKLQDAEHWVPLRQIAWLEQCAMCGLPTLFAEGIASLRAEFFEQAGLTELVSALLLFARIRHGHIPALIVEGHGEGVPGELEPLPSLPEDMGAELLAAAVRSVEGLSGSQREEDVMALLELIRLLDTEGRDVGAGRLSWALQRLSEVGSPLMQGASGAARVWLELQDAAQFGAWLGGWIDGATTRVTLHALESGLRGTLLVASPLLEADPALTEPICARVEALDDDGFLRRVAALRGGFSRLSPAARQRLLVALTTRLGAEDPRPGAADVVLEESPEWLAAFAVADRGGALAIAAFETELGQVLPSAGEAPCRTGDERRTPPASSHAIAAMDRWRLILGRERERLPPRAGRVARALDELYGQGHGEGSRGLGAGSSSDDGFPSVREWSEELDELFGTEVREEVLARAAQSGLPAALMELDPANVRPSVELLEQVLSLKGGLGERQLSHLRRLVATVVAQLVRELATRVRPALVGLATPRPSRRRVGPLDLHRTVRKNLKTARLREDGRYELVAEELVFRTRAKRSLDWHVIFVVDVSGSMEASVIYSAMMAAIFCSLPGLSTSFLAFSTEVIDLTGRVDDPLGLLLEVEIGGGTHIAKAIAYARSMLRVPRRTLVLVVSDFEEGGAIANLGTEVRALVETGATALGVAALDDRGQPRYCTSVAELVAGAGMPVAALTPLQLAQWVGDQVR